MDSPQGHVVQRGPIHDNVSIGRETIIIMYTVLFQIVVGDPTALRGLIIIARVTALNLPEVTSIFF